MGDFDADVISAFARKNKIADDLVREGDLRPGRKPVIPPKHREAFIADVQKCDRPQTIRILYPKLRSDKTTSNWIAWAKQILEWRAK